MKNKKMLILGIVLAFIAMSAGVVFAATWVPCTAAGCDNGSFTCRACNGIGMVACRNCIGGETRSGETCSTCNGRGIFACTVCRGGGAFPCPTCKGSGGRWVD